MLQKTRTMPACLNVTLREVRGAYRPTSNGWPLKFEKALWKIRSRFGRSTVLPNEIASTCGWNSLSSRILRRGGEVSRQGEKAGARRQSIRLSEAWCGEQDRLEMAGVIGDTTRHGGRRTEGAAVN